MNSSSVLSRFSVQFNSIQFPEKSPLRLSFVLVWFAREQDTSVYRTRAEIILQSFQNPTATPTEISILIRYSPELGCCAPDFGDDSWGFAAALYGVVYAILGLGLPAVLVTVCNLRVLGIARYHRHRIASAIYEVTLSAQVTITHQRNPFFVPTVTSPSAGGPPRFRSAASTVRKLPRHGELSFKQARNRQVDGTSTENFARCLRI